jgi:hypothetical protein
MASPYATLRVYRYTAVYRVSFAGLHSASKLAPWSPARSQAYGSGCVWQFQPLKLLLLMEGEFRP